MKKLFTLLCLVPAFAFAQTTHTVQVFGGGPGNPAPAYAPQNLTIDVGDIVEWNNTQGSHNVYGENDVFPNNPEGFSSGTPQGAPWTFSYTFNTPGVYDYHCTQGNHAQTQFGSVTVLDPNGVTEVSTLGDISMFPNPANNTLNVDLGSVNAASMEIYQLDGRLAQTVSTTESGVKLIDISALNEGQYFLRITSTQGEVSTLKFVRLLN